RYTPIATVQRQAGGTRETLDRTANFPALLIEGGERVGGGLVDLPHEVEFERLGGAGDVRRFFHLTWLLATTEFKLRFFGSALGYVWQLARPLMLFGVLYAVFTQIVKFGSEGVPHYPLYLLIGIVLFTSFGEATAGSVQAVVLRENLVRKIQFPRMVIPLAVVLTAGFNLMLNMIVVFVFVLASGIGPQWSWLEVPFILLPL